MASPTVTAEPTTKLWANSGDSHYLEPDGLWDQILPKHLAERMPRTEHISETEEIVHVDGRAFIGSCRGSAKATIKGEVRGEEIEGTLFEISHRPAGSRDPHARACRPQQRRGLGGGRSTPLSESGTTCSPVPSSRRIVFRAVNEWRLSEVQNVAPDRWIVVASLPVVNLEDALAEIAFCADAGYHAVGLACDPPEGCENWNSEVWDPMWSLIEETGMVVAVHLGTELGVPSSIGVRDGPC